MTGTLTGRMAYVPILPIKVSVTIDTMAFDRLQWRYNLTLPVFKAWAIRTK